MSGSPRWGAFTLPVRCLFWAAFQGDLEEADGIEVLAPCGCCGTCLTTEADYRDELVLE